MSILTYPETPVLWSTPAPEGKFLQLRWAGEDFLIFALRVAHRYHNQILDQFLTERGIPHYWSAPDRLEVAHPDLKLMGGGRFRVDRTAGRLHLWDDSQAYGRFREPELRAALGAAGPPWFLLEPVID